MYLLKCLHPTSHLTSRKLKCCIKRQNKGKQREQKNNVEHQRYKTKQEQHKNDKKKQYSPHNI